MMRTLRDQKRTGGLGLAVAVSLIAALSASEGFACGYDDPQTASRGFLNWIYPDSLYVIGAISKEVAARRLPLSNFDRGGPPDLFGHKFLLAKTSLEQFGAMLDTASSEPLQTPITVVLVEPMLWARFQATAEGVGTAVHVSGAERGDLVVITGEAVMAEIAGRRLTFGDAYARGVVRLYGDKAQIAAFLLTSEQVGANKSALDAKAKSTLAPTSIAAAASPSPPAGAGPTAGASRTSELIQ